MKGMRRMAGGRRLLVPVLAVSAMLASAAPGVSEQAEDTTALPAQSMTAMLPGIDVLGVQALASTAGSHASEQDEAQDEAQPAQSTEPVIDAPALEIHGSPPGIDAAALEVGSHPPAVNAPALEVSSSRGEVNAPALWLP